MVSLLGFWFQAPGYSQRILLESSQLLGRLLTPFFLVPTFISTTYAIICYPTWYLFCSREVPQIYIFPLFFSSKQCRFRAAKPAWEDRHCLSSPEEDAGISDCLTKAWGGSWLCAWVADPEKIYTGPHHTCEERKQQLGVKTVRCPQIKGSDLLKSEQTQLQN